MPKHTIRVPVRGPAVYYATPRDQYGDMVWIKIGLATEWKIKDSREKAREIIKRVEAGLPATEPVPPPPVKPDSFLDVAQLWMKRHVRKKGHEHITAKYTERLIDKYLAPLHHRPLVEITRSEVAKLLDHIQDGHGGARVADMALSLVKQVANFYAERHDSYTPPFIVKMKKRYTEGARDRTLSDDEIRAVWKAAPSEGTFGALVKTLLCVGQRKDLVLRMKWESVDFTTGIWSVARTSKRQKGDIGPAVRLPEMVLDILRAQPHLPGNDYIFAAERGVNPLGGHTKTKRRLDKKSGVSGWRLHDCRRTHRSLADRAKIDPRTAEIILGHAFKGAERVYDRDPYFEAKSVGLAKMAALIAGILAGEPGGKVLQFPQGA
jgi:integrase